MKTLTKATDWLKHLPRLPWFRVFVIAISIVTINVALPELDSFESREKAIRSLQSTTLIFSVCAALSLAILNNYVKGLRESYLKYISTLRDQLDKLADKLKDSKNKDEIDLLRKFVYPLLALNTGEWADIYNAGKIYDKLDEPVSRIHMRDPSFIPKHMMRIEDSYNELGTLYVRRILTELHLDNFSGTFLLIGIGIAIAGLSFLIPNQSLANFWLTNISIAVMVSSLLELYIVLSYLRQEGREEGLQDELDTE